MGGTSFGKLVPQGWMILVGQQKIDLGQIATQRFCEFVFVACCELENCEIAVMEHFGKREGVFVLLWRFVVASHGSKVGVVVPKE